MIDARECIPPPHVVSAIVFTCLFELFFLFTISLLVFCYSSKV